MKNIDYIENIKDSDKQLYNTIITNNEYSLCQEEIKDKVIVDIGANIGFFAALCLKYSAQKIYAVEPAPQTFNNLYNLYKNEKKVILLNSAVLDVSGKTVYLNDNSTSSHIVETETENKATSTTLEDIIKDEINNDMILKIDCEGSEYSILFNTKTEIIRRFEYIYIEMHEFHEEISDRNTINNLSKYIQSLGYIIENVNQYYSWNQCEDGTQTNIKEMPVRIYKFKRVPLPYIKYSIVIPSFNRCDEFLKPCIESIIQYTDLLNMEIIVVANGCTDNTEEYLKTLPKEFVSIVYKDALGYTKATNEGIKKSRGQYVILLNNDTVLLPQTKNTWINYLTGPFEKDNSIGITGPLMLHDDYADKYILIFFCVMIIRDVFSKIGLLDEVYSPGGGEDIDFCAKIEDAGYRCIRVPEYSQQGISHDLKLMTGDFPIYHKGEGTFDHIPEYGKIIIKKNGLLNCKRYNKHIKLDLGAGSACQPGYLGVDLNDPGAHIHMNASKLDFDDDSVEEIIASHLIEHINPYHVLDTFKEWKRVLKPGGKLIMEMPDIIKVCEHIVTGDKATRYGLLNCVYCPVNTTGIGEQSNITSPHLWGWWPEAMWDHLTIAGFENIQFMPEQIPHPGYNFRVECNKGPK